MNQSPYRLSQALLLLVLTESGILEDRVGGVEIILHTQQLSWKGAPTFKVQYCQATNVLLLIFVRFSCVPSSNLFAVLQVQHNQTRIRYQVLLSLGIFQHSFWIGFAYFRRLN